MRATGYTNSQFTMANSRTFKSIWTPRHGQPHIAVQPAGKNPMTAWRKIDVKADTDSWIMALGNTDQACVGERYKLNLSFYSKEESNG